MSGAASQAVSARSPCLPRPASLLIGGVTAIALAVLLTAWVGHPLAHPVELGVALVAGFLCGSRRLEISRHATISTGFVIVYLALIRLGTAEACLVALVSGLAVAVFPPSGRRNAPVVVLFAAASLAVTAWAAAQAFVLAGGQTSAIGPRSLLLPGGCAVVTYHFVNCFLVSAVASLASSAPFARLLRDNLRSTVIGFYPGAGWALLVHLALESSGAWVLPAALPPLLALHRALRARPVPQAE